jgi:cytoskeletal protein CcmA (bactofilin family)
MGLFDSGKKDEKQPMALLKREDENVVQRAGELNALLGKGSEFEGKLTFEGQVRIDGKFTGHIQTKDVLVIGEGARVQAEIVAGTVVINGTVDGNIKATTLIEIKATARVKGNLETPALSVDRGVMFDGAVKMAEMGKSAPPAPPHK